MLFELLSQNKLWDQFYINHITFSSEVSYSSGTNKHVHTPIYSQKKLRQHGFSHIKGEKNVPPTCLFRTTLLFGPLEYITNKKLAEDFFFKSRYSKTVSKNFYLNIFNLSYIPLSFDSLTWAVEKK